MLTLLRRPATWACLVTLILPCSSWAAPPAVYGEVGRWALGGDGGWDWLSVDAAARRLYLTRGTRVMVLDVDTGNVVGEVPTLQGAHGVVALPELGRGFVTSGKTGEVVAFDLKTLRVVGRAAVGDNPDALLYHPTTHKLYAFNGKGRSVVAVDPKTLAVGPPLVLGGKPEFAVSDGQVHIYVNLEDKSEVAVLDAAVGRPLAVSARYSLAPCQEPTGLAWLPKHKQLLVGCGNRLAAVVDAKDGKVVRTFATGAGVDAAVYDADHGVGFVSPRDGQLTVLTERDGELDLAEQVATAQGARTVAVDSRTGRAFLPTAQFQVPVQPPSSGPAPRPVQVPGSFFVLVVGRLAK